MSVSTARTSRFGGTASTFNTSASPGAALTTLFNAIDTALTGAGWTAITVASNNNTYSSTGESGTETLFLHLKTGAMGTGTGVNLSGGSYLMAAMCQYIDGSGNPYNELGGTHLVTTGAGCSNSSSDLELGASLSGIEYCIVADKNGLAVHVFHASLSPTNMTLLCGVLARPSGYLANLTTTADYTFTSITNTNIQLTVNTNPITAGYTIGSVVDVVAQQAGPAGVVVYCGSTISTNFIIGESVSQATSGATGKVYSYGTTGSLNGMAITNVSGTFDATHVITGGTSGATFTANQYQPTLQLTMRQSAKIVDISSTTVTLDRLDNPLGNTNKLLTGAIIGENPQPLFATSYQGTSSAWTYYGANTAMEFVSSPASGALAGGTNSALQTNSWASQVERSGSGGYSNTANTSNACSLAPGFNPAGLIGTNCWIPDLRTNSIALTTTDIIDVTTNTWHQGNVQAGMYRSSRSSSLDAVGTIRNPHSDLTHEYVCVYSTTQEMWMGPFAFVPQTVTISGGSGTVGCIIGGTTVTVTWATSDNATATALASAINSNGTVNVIVSASATTNVVTLTVLSTAARPNGGTSLAATGTGVTVNRAFVTYPYPGLNVLQGSNGSQIAAICSIPRTVVGNAGNGYDVLAQYIYDRDTPAHDTGSGASKPSNAFNQGYN